MVTRLDLREKGKQAVRGLRRRVAPKEGEISDEALEARRARAAHLQSLLMASPPMDATLEPADVDRMDEFAGGRPRSHGRMLDYALDREAPPDGSLEALAAGTAGSDGEGSMEEFVAFDLDLGDSGSDKSGSKSSDPLEFDTGGLL